MNILQQQNGKEFTIILKSMSIFCNLILLLSDSALNQATPTKQQATGMGNNYYKSTP